MSVDKWRLEAFSDSVLARIDAAVLWANLHQLFWLSLVPFATGWMGENHFAPTPVSLYGFVMLMCAIAYGILQGEIIGEQGPESIVARAVGKDLKGKISRWRTRWQFRWRT